MIKKKMKYFQEHLRNDLKLETNLYDEAFFERLSSKTGVPVEKIRKLFSLYQALSTQKEVSKDDFLRFNTLLQAFKK
jgi:hypothetical protein